jgi:hypothetical protein
LFIFLAKNQRWSREWSGAKQRESKAVPRTIVQ